MYTLIYTYLASFSEESVCLVHKQNNTVKEEGTIRIYMSYIQQGKSLRIHYVCVLNVLLDDSCSSQAKRTFCGCVWVL